MLGVYAARELGAYGYWEKPWYQPHTRLEAFFRAAPRLPEEVFRTAPPASDADLARVHDPAYVERVRALCATNRGSLDWAAPASTANSRILLGAIAEHGTPWAAAAVLAGTLATLGSTLPAFGPFLESEGLVAYDEEANQVRLTDAGRAFLGDPDARLGGPTYAREGVERAARHVCGAVIDATRRVVAGELQRAFIPIAGFHHAFEDEARMYCLYNDAALAIATALDATEGTVAYIDIDIHHGDGVARIFGADPRVCIVDIHESRAVPRGEARSAKSGSSNTWAIGPGHTDASYLAVWQQAADAIAAARPSVILFEAGVDGLATDPMSDQHLTPAVFEQLTRAVRALADTHAGGRLVVLGGGGYELDGMAAGWSHVLAALR